MAVLKRGCREGFYINGEGKGWVNDVESESKGAWDTGDGEAERKGEREFSNG